MLASRKTHRFKTVSAGLAATLLMTVSASALHAETSNAELAKEIAELKAQIRSMKGAIAGARVESRKAVRAASRAPAPYQLPPPAPAFAGGLIPPGATPAFVTADKKLQFGPLTITPGGFIAMETASRTRAEQTDILSQYGSIPTSNLPDAHVAENRFSARQSRPALLIEAPITPTYLVSGYGEFDFLGAGASSNMNQTYSYVPRVRHLYATLDNSDYGMHVLAGQEWSLVTMNSKGITPRNEVTPPQIDPAYVPGFAYARVPQIRLTKDFDKKLWLSLDAEASQTVGSGCSFATAATGIGGIAIPTQGVANAPCGTIANGGSTSGVTQNESYNKYPDVLGKVAYEAKLGDRDVHLEGFGLYRSYLSNVNYGNLINQSPLTGATAYSTSSNQNTHGYGVGGGLIIPLIPKRLDFQASGLVGRGIARYMSSNGFTDVAINQQGAVRPVGGAMALVGAIAHLTPSIDLYAFGGFEQENRTYDPIPTATGPGFVGYGAPGGFNNAGCGYEGGTCTGQQHRVFQVTGGFWDKLYKGSFGEVRVGAQYSFTQRQLFAATANANGIATAAAPSVGARANDSTILTSLRYYPFQ